MSSESSAAAAPRASSMGVERGRPRASQSSRLGARTDTSTLVEVMARVAAASCNCSVCAAQAVDIFAARARKSTSVVVVDDDTAAVHVVDGVAEMVDGDGSFSVAAISVSAAMADCVACESCWAH